MQDISCFVSPEYHPIQNRINLFFLGIRVKNFFSSKKNFFKWYSIDISKALFYLFFPLL